MTSGESLYKFNETLDRLRKIRESDGHLFANEDEIKSFQIGFANGAVRALTKAKVINRELKTHEERQAALDSIIGEVLATNRELAKGWHKDNGTNNE